MNTNKTDEDKKKDKPSKFKIGVIVFVILDIIVAIILFFVLPRYCKKPDTSGASSSSNRESKYNSQQLNTRLINLVNTEIELEGFDSDDINKVISITAVDNYPNDFSVSITCSSDSNIYVYKIDNYQYPEDKNGYDNFVSYLLKDNKELSADIGLDKYAIAKEEVINTDKVCKYVIYKSISNNKYLSGFYSINNEYRVYQHIELTDNTDPFNKPCTEVIKEDNVLYDFYTYLLQA